RGMARLPAQRQFQILAFHRGTASRGIGWTRRRNPREIVARRSGAIGLDRLLNRRVERKQRLGCLSADLSARRELVQGRIVPGQAYRKSGKRGRAFNWAAGAPAGGGPAGIRAAGRRGPADRPTRSRRRRRLEPPGRSARPSRAPPWLAPPPRGTLAGGPPDR